jgi:hypothetical protein
VAVFVLDHVGQRESREPLPRNLAEQGADDDQVRGRSPTDGVGIHSADDGPLDIGACASIEMEGERVEEIESERADKCAQTNLN